MKKGMVLVFLVMLVCSFLVAQEVEGIKIGKTMWKFNGEIRFMYTDQTDPSYYQFFIAPSADTDTINRMYQRYRFGLTGELNDRLSAHFEVQVGDEQWGNKNYNEREVNLRTLYAYLQFRPEFLGDNTTFKVGLQGYDDIFQNSIFSDEAIGILVNHKMGTFHANVGFLTLRDDDVDVDNDDGLWPSSETLYITDMSIALTDALTVKGAFYYDYLNNFYLSETAELVSSISFYGIGADYLLNDTITVGGHFVMRSGSNEATDNGETVLKIDQSGYFAYSYATYTVDKFSAKVNFGYTPFDISNGSGMFIGDITSWNGAFTLLSDNPMFMLLGYGSGDQWQTAYGLEYFGRGDVCDRQAINSGYGGLYGLMAISANLSYDFIYANIGILRATFDEDLVPDEEVDKSYGTEIDIGVKTEIMKNLEFKAVYAMFFTGDFYEALHDTTDLEDAHEMSMQLRYAF